MTPSSIYTHARKHCSMHFRCWMSLTSPIMAGMRLPQPKAVQNCTGAASPRCDTPTEPCTTSNIAHLET